ncbi:AAA family ATPase [Variovorax sp. VaC1]|uniref:AAA family ATPase n=1 Tax=Variovorax sp. VaC1 TaxID=3373132 RepID=UPI00374A037D
MRLASFQITNFRSINDSGSIDSSQITAILGRNDSGKSNLLRALHSLNPTEGLAPLSPIKDFPRHRRLEECTGDTPVVHTRWALDDGERAALAAIFPRATGVSHVTASRGYGTARWAGFEGLAELSIDVSDIKGKVRKIVPAIKAAAEKVGEEAKAMLEQEADAFDAAMIASPDFIKWSAGAVKATQALRKALASVDAELSDKQEQMLVELEELSLSIANDKPALDQARAWVIEKLPRFIYVDEYPALPGRQNLADYLARKSWGQTTPGQQSFEKLCKVAGLDPQQLQDLQEKNDQATRNQLANRAGSVVTAEIRRLWKDRPLKVRFNLDGQHLDTMVSDPNGSYEVEVNLDERSRGFQWFFSFYIAFFADTKGGEAEDAILLLDEPGLHLHPHSQADLLAHFEKDFGNQIIYTTHSPFMVPTHRVDAVRTASLDEARGTTVSNTAEGDERTLFPLKAALALSRIAGEPVKPEPVKAVAAKAEVAKAAPAKAVAGEGVKPAKAAKPVEAVKPVEVVKPVEAVAVAETAPVVAPVSAPVAAAPLPAKQEPAKPVVVETAKPAAEATPVAVAMPVVAAAEAVVAAQPEPVKPVVVAESTTPTEAPASAMSEQADSELTQPA